jgi:hypothetical protein
MQEGMSNQGLEVISFISLSGGQGGRPTETQEEEAVIIASVSGKNGCINRMIDAAVFLHTNRL